MDFRNISKSTAGMNFMKFHKIPIKRKVEIFEEVQESIRLPLASIEKDW